MLNIQIIGGGLAGLAAQSELHRRGINTPGSEQEASLGGKQRFGAHRVYTGAAKALLSSVLPEVEWALIEESPQQLRKGELEPLSDEEVSGLSIGEQALLGRPFFQPSVSFSGLVSQLAHRSGSAFSLRSSVTSLDMEKRELSFASGESKRFELLIWTGSLASLMRAIGQVPVPETKKAALADDLGSVTWDLVTASPVIQTLNSLVFVFRYKDIKLRAIGTPGKALDPKEHLCHWTVFLEDSLLEDHEELAKVCRAFKRELTKNFPSLSGGVIRETFAFHQKWGPPPVRSIRSLEIFEGVACLGSDCRSEALSPGNDTTLSALDRELLNCQEFLDHLLPAWLERTEAKLGTDLPAQAPSMDSELTIR